MGVKIQDIIEMFKMDVVVQGVPDVEVEENELNRSGLQLTGFYGYFEEKRIQLLGSAEVSYLNSLDEGSRQVAVENLMKHNIPCIIITYSNAIPDEVISFGRKYKRWVLSTCMKTSNLSVSLTSYLQNILAETISFHGTLLDLFGVGVLIIGQSGIGKSETALELIKRDHLLVADDCVLVKKPSPDTLIGTGSELTKNLIEIRGIGILDIKSIFGLRAIRIHKNIEIVVQLEPWDEKTYYDRVGEEYEHIEIMGVSLPMTRVPVRAGRNLAVIVEVAALNYRQNVLGYNAARELDEKIKSLSK
jgi:HPr kinase/phosphorylase